MYQKVVHLRDGLFIVRAIVAAVVKKAVSFAFVRAKFTDIARFAHGFCEALGLFIRDGCVIRAVKNYGGRQIGTDVLKRRDFPWVFGKTFARRFSPATSTTGLKSTIALGRVVLYMRCIVGPLLSRKLSIFNPMWLVGVGAEAAFAVCFVLRIVSVEVDDFAIPFKGQDMRGNAVEEPAIM